MADAAQKLTMTSAEYLAFERASLEQKHEFVDGEIFAMSGGTMEHGLLAMNIGAELRVALFDKPCRAVGSDVKVRSSPTKYHYPDVSVVCGRPLFEDETRDVLLNPKVIIEVLSESTERYDRGDKFESYSAIASFEDYVLLSQDAVRVEHFHRQSDGTWIFRRLGPGETLHLASIQCQISVDRVYHRVFEESQSSA
ncbi:MAG: Uma2 family endonuclease [Polyangiaceae bacterium]